MPGPLPAIITTMTLRLSTDGRHVVEWLEERGIPVSVEDGMYIEHAVSHFYPNHVISVLEHILSRGRVADRLMKAQDQGWDYFRKPVWSMLPKRKHARRGGDIRELPEGADFVWRLVQGFVLTDLNRAEADAVLYEIPDLIRGKRDILDGIRVSRDRDVRTIPYLHGVLRRKQQERTGRARECRDSEDPWEPPEDWEPLDAGERAELEIDWRQSNQDIDIMRGLRDVQDDSS